MAVPTQRGFCSLHKIAFRRDLDPICPQCSLARIVPFHQLEYDDSKGKPLDAQGNPIDPALVVPQAI